MNIKTLAKFLKDELIEGIEDYEWVEFIFNTDSLDVCNRASEGYTTIELKSGMRQTIAIKWEDFKNTVGKEYKTIIDSKAAYEFSEQELE